MKKNQDQEKNIRKLFKALQYSDYVYADDICMSKQLNTNN